MQTSLHLSLFIQQATDSVNKHEFLNEFLSSQWFQQIGIVILTIVFNMIITKGSYLIKLSKMGFYLYVAAIILYVNKVFNENSNSEFTASSWIILILIVGLWLLKDFNDKYGLKNNTPKLFSVCITLTTGILILLLVFNLINF